MSAKSNMISPGAEMNAQIRFPLPLDELENNLTRPAEESVEEDQLDVANTEIFHRPIDIPRLKKYFEKLERRICIWLILSQVFMLGALFFGINIILKTWGTSSAIDSILNWVSSVASNTVLKYATCGVVSGLLYLCLKNVERLRDRKRYAVHENSLCKMMYYPTTMTPSSCQNVLAAFKWRLNFFWVAFTAIGLAVNVLTVANGWYLYQHIKDDKGAEFYWDKFAEFSKMFEKITGHWELKKIPDGLVDIAFWLLISGITLMIGSNPLSRMIIKNILGIFNLNEYNMGPELRDEVFRINKRNKIYTLIFLCLTGLASFIIFKRLIIAVFNKSFKYSKR